MSMPAEHLSMTTNLAELLAGLADAPAIPIRRIASDSRRIGEGDLFLACAGQTSHGLDYLDEARGAGAAAVAYETPANDVTIADSGIPLIAIDELSRYVGDIANRFYGNPSKSVRVIGVTGTNGKTTVAWLIAQCLERLGLRCGYIGTLGSGIGEIDVTETLTTPAGVELHGLLAEFRDRGAQYAALEVSSHALAQRRIAGMSFDSVLFTNLTRDHLDYHGNMRVYADAKARLFAEYPAVHRIINLDTEFGAELAARCDEGVVTVSTNMNRVANDGPFLFVSSVVANATGSQIRIRSSWGNAEFLLPLVGDFNIANAVIALALLLTQGIDIEDACAVLTAVSAPPGRMQLVPARASSPAVYVDYAHTPAGLESALNALRRHCRDGQLWCVFGCGGDRDPGKRPLMGRVTERLADRVIVTSDNPRGESSNAIIDDIVAGFSKPERATIIVDRGAAIAWTIAEARPSDVILIAGKGHETYQLVGNERRDFSDFGAASANLDARSRRPEADA